MKKSIIILFTIMLLAYFTGCGSQNADDFKYIRTFTVEANDMVITPYENFAWVQIHTENGWLAGDGIGATYILPDLAEKLPEIQMDATMSFNVSENGHIQTFDIFDEKYTRIYHRITEGEFRKLANGVYYISVLVKWTGDYIESENNYEATADEYLFKMTVCRDTIE